MGLLIALGGITTIFILRRGGPLAVLTIWGGILGGGLFVAFVLLAPDQFFTLIGKDPTLTGRTGIWEALFRRVEERPLLGYGFGAFWQDRLGPSWFIKHEVQWSAPNAHNGWLDMLVQLGWIGLALAIGHFLISLTSAVRRFWGGPEAYWTIVFMALFALFSISESTVMQYNGISWVLYTATAAKLLEWRGFASGSAPPTRSTRLFPDDEPDGLSAPALR